MRVTGRSTRVDFSASRLLPANLFLRSCELNGLSSSTILFYRQFLGYFLTWLGDREINAVTVDDYKLYLIQKRRSDGKTAANRPTSVNTHLRAIKSFVSWASRQGLIQGFGVQLVRERNRLNRAIPLENVRKLLEAARTEGFEGMDSRGQRYHGGRTRARDVVIIWILFETGIRPGELCSIQLEDLNLSQNTIRVQGKTGERLVVFEWSRKALLAHLHHRKANPGVTTLFTRDTGEAMTMAALKSTFYRLGRLAGIKHSSAYGLRHACATEHIREGAGLVEVMYLLGHSRIATTQRYVQTVLADVAKMQKKHNPANRLK